MADSVWYIVFMFSSQILYFNVKKTTSKKKSHIAGFFPHVFDILKAIVYHVSELHMQSQHPTYKKFG